ncbi:hypothetical protein K439DRAFT_1326613 [Ramaria rubella]|nr:hypothetical protein K439DRAFT_1326613 [Ramaria rubella]
MAKLLPRNILQKSFSQQHAFKYRDGRQSRDNLLRIIAQTHIVHDAWEAYNALLSMHNPRPSESGFDDRNIPYEYLHRLARLLSSARPRTRKVYLRLLSVLTTLRTTGGPIFVWEWNALIDCAGKGWRKTRIEDYRAAVDVFKDMIAAGQAAPSLPPALMPFVRADALPVEKVPVAKPDIVTFTTLLNIASKTLSDNAIVHAMSLLAASELPWNSATHLARLHYFIHTNQMHAIRSILLAAVTRGLDIITLNGCLWAYAYKGRLRVVMQVYDLLRRNISAKDRMELCDPSPFSLDTDRSNGQDENPFLTIPGFTTQATMAPDMVTYTMLIQALCYHGDLIGGLTVFRDMVTTVNTTFRPTSSRRGGAQSAYYKPNCSIYRAIFLGFARHAHKKSTLATNLITTSLSPSPEDLLLETPWSLENLDKIFERFLELDWEAGTVADEDMAASARPSERMIYWIMVAYAKATKRDIRKMYNVWKRLDARFGYEVTGMTLRGRLGRIGKELDMRCKQTNEATNRVGLN